MVYMRFTVRFLHPSLTGLEQKKTTVYSDRDMCPAKDKLVSATQIHVQIGMIFDCKGSRGKGARDKIGMEL